MKTFLCLSSMAILSLLATARTARAQLSTTATYSEGGCCGGWGQKQIAIGNDGYARFLGWTWDESNPDIVDLVYVHCLDAGCDTYNTSAIPASTAWSYSLAIGPDGYARIAYETEALYYDGGGEPYYALGFVQCSDDDCYSYTSNSNVAQAGADGVNSVAVGSDGTAYIVFDYGTDGDTPQTLNLATCSGGGCSTAVIVTDINSCYMISGAIAMGSDGNPVIAYASQNFCPWGPPDPGVVYLYADGSTATISGDEGYSNLDLSIGSDGFARVVFANAANSDDGEAPAINFVQCTNASCTSFASNAIGVGSDYAGMNGSVGVAPDGTPRLQVDDGEGDSYYVQCGVEDCSSYSTQGIPALVGNSGGLASLAMASRSAASMLGISNSCCSGTAYYLIDAPAQPIISGPSTLWWFNGLGSSVSGYATQITLTANSGGLGTTYEWAIASGTDKISLSTGTSSTVHVTSVGESTSANDTSVTVTVGGVTSVPFTLTVRAPYALGTDPNNPTLIYSSDPTYAWNIQIPYRVLDNLLTPMPNPVSINENWTASVVNDYGGTNWRRGSAGCVTLGSGGAFFDFIQGETSDRTPTPVYNVAQNGSAVQHWGQEWRVGTCSNGSGPRVQTDTIQKYTDHAAHTNIVSPAP